MQAAPDTVDEAGNPVIRSLPARAGAESVDAYVRTHPWSAVAFAIGVGLLAGLLLAR
jgi:ElaB/YqjD/DUF883 family membrane-anchored ribosome-binding protein